MEALIEHLRGREFGGRVVEPPSSDPAGRAGQLHQRLQEASEQASMGLDNSKYVRPHLVRKLLLWELVQGSIRAPDSLANLLDMQMPDEQGHLATIPSYLARGHALRTRFNCPLLLLSCYACLAKPALQQHPEALEMTLRQPAKVRAALAAYREAHGIAPSLEQLFQTVLPKQPGQPRARCQDVHQLPQ